MSEHDVEAGIRVQRRLLQAQLPLREAIVGIEKRKELSRGVLNGTIASRAVATVLLLDHLHPSETPSNVRGAVRRTVVDHDQLDRLIVLSEHALNRLSEIRSGVVRADHHADKRIHDPASSAGGCSRPSFARRERRRGSWGARPAVRLDAW